MKFAELRRNLYLLAILGQSILILYVLMDISFSLRTIAEQTKIAADNPECEWVAAMIEKEKKSNLTSTKKGELK